MIGQLAASWANILVWGFVATAALSVVLQGSQGLGLSRLSLPFLVGTLFSGNRSRASVYGFLFYLLGGWLFAVLYFLVLRDSGLATAWAGALLGALHGLFLLVVVLPLLPFLHPRIATEYDAPNPIGQLEPPGFLGINYGNRTPLVSLLGHALYGAILGAAF